MTDKGKPCVIADFSIVPIGGGSTSIGHQVAIAVKAMTKVRGIRHQLTPMGTVLEAEGLDPILEAVRVAHEALVEAGSMRVESTLRVDDRRDKPRSMADMVSSVERHMRQIL